MYRGCELSSYMNANNETTLDVYQYFIDAIIRITSKDKTTANQPESEQHIDNN